MIKMVDVRKLKDRAITFPEPVKTLILTEPDELPVEEFLSLINTSEKLLKIKKGGN